MPALFLLLALWGCTDTSARKRKLVVATIYPYELLARQLVGAGVEVQTLIPPSASPHTWTPRPSDLKAIREATLVISNGLGLETQLQQALRDAGDKHVCVAELLGWEQPKALDLHAAGTNPHVWLSPRLLSQATLQLSRRLQESLPELGDAIGNNALKVLSGLAALHKRITSERGALERTPVITYHDSFHYFFQEYGIDYLGSIQSSPGREPNPRELSALGDLIRKSQVKAICVEPQMERKSAQVLASEFGLRIIELDPLGTTFQPQAITDVILGNWEALRKGWQ